MALKPLGDHLVVAPIKLEEKSAGGVFLPDEAIELPQEGHVVAVGSGRLLTTGQRVPIEIKVGDVVIYSKYAGSTVKEGTSDLLLITEKDVLAIRTVS